MSKKNNQYAKKSKGKNKTKGNYSNNSGRDNKNENSDIVIEKTNDPLWYNSNNQLSFDAGTYSFNTGLGTSFTLHNSEAVIPGICAISILPMPFVTNDSSDPVNVTARALFSNVLRANSRSNPDYEAADLMIYIMALANAWSYLYWARRVYGLCNTYSQYNRYLPQALLQADGIDFKSIVNNMASFRYEINAYATQLATYCVPNDIPYFKRMCWLFSNVYMDEPTNRASYYIYHPETFGIWSDTGVNGSSLKFSNFNLTAHADGSNVFGQIGVNPEYIGVAHFRAGFEKILNALHDSTDVNNMSGDILKAYGSENMLTPDTIPADYAVFPEYVPEVLSQIHNTILVGNLVETDLSNAVEQSEDSLNLYSNVFFSPYGYGHDTSIAGEQSEVGYAPKVSGPNMLDIIKDNPTSDDVLVATRLMPSLQISDYSFGGAEYKCLTPKYAGMDIATNMYIVTAHNRYNTNLNKQSNGTYDSYGPYTTLQFVVYDLEMWRGSDPTRNNRVTPRAFLEMINLLGTFEQHPYMYGYFDDPVDANVYLSVLPYGDIDNYITLDEQELKRIHQAAMFSLFNVPGLAIR